MRRLMSNINVQIHLKQMIQNYKIMAWKIEKRLIFHKHRYPRITKDMLAFSQPPNVFLYASTKIALVGLYNAMPDMSHKVTFIELRKP